MRKTEVLVVGAGIAGLTSAAILSKVGLSVTLIEAHTQSGGCAGTFKRKNYIFDVGATQVAGLEKGGIHSKIFEIKTIFFWNGKMSFSTLFLRHQEFFLG